MMRKLLSAFLVISISMAVNGLLCVAPTHGAEEFVVYQVSRALDFGNPGEVAQTDFFTTMGSNHGLRKGSIIEVLRRQSSYDVRGEKLYKDVAFAFARLKVIHVENNASIARLEKLLPLDQTPVIMPPQIMMGDTVRKAE